MCRAFSCIVEPNAKVIWKFGVDSHTDLLQGTGLKDDSSGPALLTFARVEITPNNGSYLAPDDWQLKVDQAITPTWFGEKHKSAAWDAHKKWAAKLYKILIRKDIVHPFELTPPKIEKKHIKLFKEWASVWASVWDSVRASVGDSVRASVGAYTSGFFNIPKWKYVKHPRGKNPYRPLIKLWESGLVPSFDGKVWRLHGGKKAAILFTILADELKAAR